MSAPSRRRSPRETECLDPRQSSGLWQRRPSVPRLARNTLTTRTVMASSMSNLAPLMSFVFSFPVIVLGAGTGSAEVSRSHLLERLDFLQCVE